MIETTQSDNRATIAWKGGKISSSGTCETVTEDLPFVSSESQKGRKRGEPEKVVRDNSQKLPKFGNPSPPTKLQIEEAEHLKQNKPKEIHTKTHDSQPSENKWERKKISKAVEREMTP